MAAALGCRLSVLASRYKDVNLNRQNKRNGVACRSNLNAMPILSSSRSLQQRNHNLHSWAPKGLPSLQLSSTSSTLLRGDQGDRSHNISVLPRQRKSSTLVQAQKSNSISIPFPKMKEKPEWWWRTLACFPYLIALQMSDTGFYIQPFAEHYELFGDLVYYVPGAIKRLPYWFTMIYFFFAYFGVVKRKEWPHFFRYHVIMAMLLETMLQVVWYSSNFFPLIHFNGIFGIEYWAVVAFVYVSVLLECIRCALAGKYVKLPFFSTPALVHTLFQVEGYHKPF
ncbi:protein TIC 20-IV, chloroplastic [Pyrus x bretschneideri]|uniref:protein TIC 20-IV, chloroplastic n=1 Tax=Pyrus x bretschneideri TaxID=225117 RepID=UPI00202DFC73|nr:protein TIC 20-IV, chloroplastic [Pyrus x bretschneideri]